MHLSVCLEILEIVLISFFLSLSFCSLSEMKWYTRLWSGKDGKIAEREKTLTKELRRIMT
jgi:hypothetical protein